MAGGWRSTADSLYWCHPAGAQLHLEVSAGRLEISKPAGKLVSGQNGSIVSFWSPRQCSQSLPTVRCYSMLLNLRHIKAGFAPSSVCALFQKPGNVLIKLKSVCHITCAIFTTQMCVFCPQTAGTLCIPTRCSSAMTHWSGSHVWTGLKRLWVNTRALIFPLLCVYVSLSKLVIKGVTRLFLVSGLSVKGSGLAFCMFMKEYSPK